MQLFADKSSKISIPLQIYQFVTQSSYNGQGQNNLWKAMVGGIMKTLNKASLK